MLSSYFTSVGSYTDQLGIEFVRAHVAAYIAQRDGYPSDKDNIILTNGVDGAIQVCFRFDRVRVRVKVSLFASKGKFLFTTSSIWK